MAGWTWTAVAVCLPFLSMAAALASDLKFETQLVWATNDAKSPNEKHKPVEPEVRKKLESLSLKWKNFFEVNRVSLKVPKGESRKSSLSDKCSIEVKAIDSKKIEVIFYGQKGEVCSRRTQPLSTDEILVHGGNAANSTAWLVVLKRIE